MFCRAAVVLVSLSWAHLASADQFHYQNLVIGDRAMGLGGAFGAVADDASGVYYNPAGLGFALTNDVSGTANAFLTRKIVYKNALGATDFKEDSKAQPPVFFGILQKLDNVSKGLTVAFALMTTDSELKNQDDLINNVAITSKYKGGAERQSQIHRYHRTVNARGSTNQMGIAVAKRISSGICVGFGLNYTTVEELVQEYQDTRAQAYGVDDAGTPTLSTSVGHQTQNIRQNLSAKGLQSTLGIQAALGGKFSIGLTARAGKWLSSNLDFGFEQLQLGIPQEGSKAIADAISAGQNVSVTAQSSVKQNQVIQKKEDVLGAMPAEARLGFGWFASTRALVTADATWYDGVPDADPQYSKDRVLNFSTGLEYYLVPSIPVRVGVFTNNDSRPKLDHAEQAQRDHIDYLGESLFFAWVQPNSQIALGAVLQQGKGEAQKTGDLNVQEVIASSSTFAFSLSQSL
jgi:long-chain fatty acid transport protein